LEDWILHLTKIAIDAQLNANETKFLLAWFPKEHSLESGHTLAKNIGEGDRTNWTDYLKNQRKKIFKKLEGIFVELKITGRGKEDILYRNLNSNFRQSREQGHENLTDSSSRTVTNTSISNQNIINILNRKTNNALLSNLSGEYFHSKI
jgi:hypothetical protein